MNFKHVATVVAVLAVMVPMHAQAFSDYVGPRALAMGGAGRADARGDQALLLNPAGMSLGKLYTVEGGYQWINRDGGHSARAAVVDSTSGFNLAGGIFYGYRTASPAGVASLSGHQAGLALSYPFADRVMLGMTGKYLYTSGGLPEPDGVSTHSGITFDAGVIVRASTLTVGAVGYNLRDLKTVQAPVALGYGLAWNPTTNLALVLDALHDFTTSDVTRGVRTSFGGGGEFMFPGRIVGRLGGGRDGRLGHGYVSAGVAIVSEVGAIDVAFRQDVSGDMKSTFVAAGVRLFVPQQ